jgi:hypothetical protein
MSSNRWFGAWREWQALPRSTRRELWRDDRAPTLGEARVSRRYARYLRSAVGVILLFLGSLLAMGAVLLVGQIARGWQGGPGGFFVSLMTLYFLVVLPWQRLRAARRLEESALRILGGGD